MRLRACGALYDAEVSTGDMCMREPGDDAS